MEAVVEVEEGLTSKIIRANDKMDMLLKNVDDACNKTEKEFPNITLSLLERIVRVEEELKYLRVDMDKRFNMMMWTIGGGFSISFGALGIILGMLFKVVTTL